MAVLLPLQIGTFTLINRSMLRHLPPFEQLDFSRDVVVHRLVLEGYFGMFSILVALFSAYYLCSQRGNTGFCG
ncbi:MAG TPA: hypothetical protein VGN44_19840 [Candidatus Angelobacter sp.]